MAGAAHGPAVIQQWLHQDLSVWQRLKPTADHSDDLWPQARQLAVIQPLLSALHQSVRQYYLEHHSQRLLLLSGDHSSACAAIGGLKAAFPDKRIGVIWIDAHADIHTPASTPSGNLHGMPLGAVLVADAEAAQMPLWQATQKLCAGAISPEDLVYIGIRDLEAAEWQLLERGQICAYTATEVAVEGASTIGQKTLRHLSAAEVIYLSFDIDALDASIASATGTPVPAGLNETQVILLLKMFLADPRVQLFEVTEFAPPLDEDGKTAGMLQRLLAQTLPELTKSRCHLLQVAAHQDEPIMEHATMG